MPVRYPLTDTSVQTLRYATELADERTSTELLVLHVNLFQNETRAQRHEISRAIAPIVGTVDSSLLIRSAFFVEEAIADEAKQVGADQIVVGKNQRPRWRSVVNRLFGNEPNISAHLEEHTDATIDVVE